MYNRCRGENCPGKDVLKWGNLYCRKDHGGKLIRLCHDCYETKTVEEKKNLEHYKKKANSETNLVALPEYDQDDVLYCIVAENYTFCDDNGKYHKMKKIGHGNPKDRIQAARREGKTYTPVWHEYSKIIRVKNATDTEKEIKHKFKNLNYRRKGVSATEWFCIPDDLLDTIFAYHLSYDPDASEYTAQQIAELNN